MIVGLALDSKDYPQALPYAIGFFFWFGTILLVPSFIGGLGLLRHKRWARVLMIFVSIEFLFAFPVGTVLGVYGLWALLKHVVPNTGPTPAKPAYVPQPRGAQASLAPPPPASHPLPMPSICSHLQSIEHAIYLAGIAITSAPGTSAKFNCRINLRALIGSYALSEPVRYREYFQAERYFEDFPIAEFRCAQCNSAIATLHPYDCNMRTPWFPAPPAPLTLRAERRLASSISITAIACSPSGRQTAIAAGIYNTPQEIAIWDTSTAERSIVLPPHGVIRSIAWSADEKVLVTGRGLLWTQGEGSQGPSIFVWDAASGEELVHFGDDLFCVRSIALSPDGRTVLASGILGTTRTEGSTLDLWDLASGKLLKRLASVEPVGKVSTLPFFTGVAFTHDSALALAASDLYLNAYPRRFDHPQLPSWWNRGIRAFRVSDGQEIDLLPHQPTPVRSIAISRDGSRLLFAGARFGVWNLTTGSQLWDKINGYDIGLAISPDGTVIARGIGYQEDNHGPYVDTAVELYDVASGDLISLGHHRTPPTAIDFAASRNAIVAGGEEGDLRFWSFTSE